MLRVELFYDMLIMRFVLLMQDAEGKTPLHIAIENQHVVIISLLMSHPLLNLNLKDKLGRTPFATAMLTRNNKAAQMILDREPTAAEQVRLYIYYGLDWNM